MKKILTTSISLFFLTVSTITNAVSINTHFNSINNDDPDIRQSASAYLNGLVDTSIYFNAALKNQYNINLFCMPDNQKLNARTLGKLIKETYKNDIKFDEKSPHMNTAMIAVIGLIKNYPCDGEYKK
ncbi:Rap1a family protein [Photobacterium sp. R1]